MENTTGKKSGSDVRLRHVLQGLLVGFVVGWLIIFASVLDFNKHMELTSLDLRYRLRPQIPVLTEIGYIEYDDASLELFGKWPWPRSRQVELVRTLDFYDARAAGYDVFFLENEDVVFQPSVIKRFLSGGNREDGRTDVSPLVDNAFQDYDRLFEEAIRRGENIYLASISHDPSRKAAAGGMKGVLKETAERRRAFSPRKRQAMEELEKTLLDTPADWGARLYKTTDVDAPLPELTRAARGVGFAQPGYDSDSIVRNYLLFRYYNGKTMYAITLKMLSHILDFKLNEIQWDHRGHVVIKNARDYRTGERKDLIIPVDAQFQTLMNWAGGFNDAFLHIPFATLNRFYAYMAAKDAARGFSGRSAGEMENLKERIFRRLADERLVREEEAAAIAGEIAAAQVASNLLAGGKGKEDFAKLFGDSANAETGRLRAAAELVSEGRSMAEALAENPALGFEEFVRRKPPRDATLPQARLQETFKNIKWFAARGRLPDAAPYYFPPPQLVLNNGLLSPFSPVDLEGKIFMIGLTGSHTIDLKPTPFEKSAPMVAYHVNALNTVLTGNFLRFPPAYSKYAATLGLSVIVGLAGSVLTIPVSLALTLLVTGLYLFATFHLWVINGQWLEWAAPLEAVSFTYLTIIVIQFLRAFMEKRKIRGIFSTMVSPTVLRVMEENPDKFSLTGERRAATTFFSKIDGIGTVTKSISPEELTQFLSYYLTPNSEIIMAYDGYIDKYEGHVIMADFGVPLEDAGNPWKCAFAAVEQRLDIEAFRYFVQADYGLDIGVSMGFNHGYVSAGNMGSERKFQYTVMGDPVNVAARFMAANFIYGSPNPITGEETTPAIGDYVYLRPLDKLLLKGKTKPTAIYDVMGWKSEAYLALRGKQPVPDFIETIWSKCPPGKIFGYRRFWRHEAARNGHPLAGKIAEFFDSSLDLAAALMVNEWKAEAERCRLRFDALISSAASVVTHAPGKERDAAGRECREILDDWSALLRELIEAARGNGSGASEAGELEREGGILLHRLDLLRCRTEVKDAAEERIGRATEALREYLPLAAAGQGEGAENLERRAGEIRNEYARAVAAFCKDLKKAPVQYHEMMSRAGAPDNESIEGARLFAEGLDLYWARQWRPALDKFRAAGAVTTDAGPVASYIERIETYETAPPGPEWQGEFVQTKK